MLYLDFLQTINDHSSEGQLVQQCNEFQTDSDRPISIPDLGSGVSDDDFFHLTCHIEPNLIHKIEKGEFIEFKFGTKCKFIERCKYCDSQSHGVNNCFKLQQKKGEDVVANKPPVQEQASGH